MDSVFPIDNANNFILTNSNCVPLGVLIILKSLCKLYKTYDYEVLSQISLATIYYLLTGITLDIHNRQYVSSLSSYEFHRLVLNHKKNGSLCLRYVKGEHKIYILEIGTVKHSTSASNTLDSEGQYYATACERLLMCDQENNKAKIMSV